MEAWTSFSVVEVDFQDTYPLYFLLQPKMRDEVCKKLFSQLHKETLAGNFIKEVVDSEVKLP